MENFEILYQSLLNLYRIWLRKSLVFFEFDVEIVEFVIVLLSQTGFERGNA